jgi:CheY-like chemotaxis protein
MSSAQPNDAAPLSASPARILLAEDNPVNQKVAMAMLRKLGHAVEIVPNGAEAVAAMDRSEFDLVFMDCQMPHMDGYEATTRIRQSEHGGRRTPIIAMTANALSGDREHCLAAGMDDYLSKPIDPATLSAVLDRWLSPVPAGARQPSPTPIAVTAQTAPASNATIVRVERLKGVVGDEEATVRSYLQLFVSIVDGLVAQLGDAVRAGDAKATRRLAHQIKGSAASIGAEHLAALAADMEKHAAAGATDGASEQLASLEPAYRDVVAFIGAY